MLVRTERANSALRRVVGKKPGTAEQSSSSGFWSKGMAGGCLRGNKAVSQIQPVKSSQVVLVIWQEGVWMGRMI